MKYKLCVCDMDGTLLNSNGLITEKNELALKRLQDNGVELIIASGRTDLMMKSYINQLNFKGYIICCNGAFVKNIERNELIYKKILDNSIAFNIIKYCFTSNYNFLVYTDNIVFSNRNNHRAKHFDNLNETLPEKLRIPIKYFDLESINLLENLDIIKILMVESDEKILDSIKDHLSKYRDISVVSSANGLLDIWATGISKGKAIKELAEKLGVNLKNIIAFGDNYNDVEMFEAVGCPIAMGNAVEQVKSLAKYITKTNDEDGIAFAIENIL